MHIAKTRRFLWLSNTLIPSITAIFGEYTGYISYICKLLPLSWCLIKILRSSGKNNKTNEKKVLQHAEGLKNLIFKISKEMFANTL